MTKFPLSRSIASVEFRIGDIRAVDQTVSVKFVSRTRLPSGDNSSFKEAGFKGLSLFATQTIILSAKFVYQIPR
jgi:hypothetical protein